MRNLKIRYGTIIRTILQILAYANQIIALIGKNSFADVVWYQWFSLIFTVVVSCLSYWYNNDWTDAAKLATDVFDVIKDGKVTKEEVTEFIEKRSKTNKKEK